MQTTSKLRVQLSAAGLLLAALSLAWAAAGSKLVINGKVASNNVRVIDGKAYAPLTDVAKALNMVVAKNGNTYELAVAGGADQVSGSRQGRIGDWLFTGKWRFQVVGVKEVEEYTQRHYGDRKTIRPKQPGDTLIVVDCRIKNGTKQQLSPVLTERMPRNTALTDGQDRSYAPLDYDARQQMNKIQSYEAEPLLPGAAADFALVFSVPAGTKPGSLVFTCFEYPPPTQSDQDDVRVALD